MKLENYISNCRSPRLIVRDGGTRSVRCGRCPDCLHARAVRNANMVKSECDSVMYSYFVTLTYAEHNIPRCLITEFYDEDLQLPFISYKDITRRPTKKRTKRGLIVHKPLPEYGKILHTFQGSLSDPLFQDFLTKAKEYPHVSFLESHKVIRYLRKKDLQDFFKRLRRNIDKIGYSKITYFGCGEYGPQTFRPHFHAVIHFNDAHLATCIEQLVRKSWKFGDVRQPSFVRKSENAGQYVGGYINSYVALPRYLKNDAMLPFSCHSLYYGKAYYKPLRDYLYQNPEKANFEHDAKLCASEDIHYFPTSATASRIYPRCYNYDRQNPKDLYKIYTCFRKLSETYQSDSPRQIAYQVLNNSNDFYNRTLLDLLDIGTPDISPYYSLSSVSDPHNSALNLGLLKYTWRRYEALDDDIIDESPTLCYQRRIYSRVYTAILMSKHFLTWNCENIEPLTALSLIKQYYDTQKQEQLRNQYEQQETYHQITDLVDFSIFYPSSFSEGDYSDIYISSSYIKIINDIKDIKYENDIKHKKLNDANKIFL